MTALEVLRQEGDFRKYKKPVRSGTGDEKNIREGEAVARRAAEILRNEFHATRVILFGSLGRRDAFDLSSDIDLAAWGIPTDLLFAAVARLEDLDVKWKVDLYCGHPDAAAFLKLIGQDGVEL